MCFLRDQVRDILGDANTLKWAGISLGKETTYNLKLAMQVSIVVVVVNVVVKLYTEW